ncbi:flavodoxin domain-containing protein [Lujinxingia vulgaris]|uniref:flavodoxin domain-containing protein n=1 Tax=Lujinxingia vulgaris TaxID=2600176 RepID=UPI001E4E61BD|nr:flavodoxin domain-containing protein [Lujinxingia vulgaris]
MCLSAAGDDEESRQEVHHYADVFLEATGWQPMLLAAFAGAMPFSRYGFMKRLIMRSAGRRGFAMLGASVGRRGARGLGLGG